MNGLLGTTILKKGFVTVPQDFRIQKTLKNN
jgi:hypothetical protein